MKNVEGKVFATRVILVQNSKKLSFETPFLAAILKGEKPLEKN